MIAASAGEVAFDPADSIDLLGLLIVYAGVWIPAVGTLIVVLRGARREKDRAAKTDEIHEHTVNSHRSSNLRAQIDRLEANVGAINSGIVRLSDQHDRLRDDLTEVRECQTQLARCQEELRGDVRRLSEELHTERVERIEGDRRQRVVPEDRL